MQPACSYRPPIPLQLGRCLSCAVAAPMFIPQVVNVISAAVHQRDNMADLKIGQIVDDLTATAACNTTTFGERGLTHDVSVLAIKRVTVHRLGCAAAIARCSASWSAATRAANEAHRFRPQADQRDGVPARDSRCARGAPAHGQSTRSSLRATRERAATQRSFGPRSSRGADALAVRSCSLKYPFHSMGD